MGNTECKLIISTDIVYENWIKIQTQPEPPLVEFKSGACYPEINPPEYIENCTLERANALDFLALGT
jgi:hypothetical protein